jgi:hypothetical protein
VLVFGGTTEEFVGYDDLSTYNIETDVWATNVAASGTTPAGRYGHTAVATTLNTMIVFGGRNGSILYNDVQILDMVEMEWLSNTTTGTPPSPRAYHTAVIDHYQHIMYVYGGTVDGQNFFSDMYMLDLDLLVWSQVTPVDTPVGRAMHSAVMSLEGVMVVFGGIGLSDVACFNTRNHTWYACLLDPSPAPSVRYGHTAVYSPLQMMVVYGGYNAGGNPVSDVWNFDLNLWIWHIVTPGGVGINPRAQHSAVATTFGTMIIFGGIDGDGSVTNDFGLYNLANTVLKSANDGITLVVLVTLMGTIMLALCFTMDYMKEQSEIEKHEAVEKTRAERELLPKLPAIPKALHIPLGPRAQKFFEEFKMSLDPMQDPPK